MLDGKWESELPPGLELDQMLDAALLSRHSLLQLLLPLFYTVDNGLMS